MANPAPPAGRLPREQMIDRLREFVAAYERDVGEYGGNMDSAHLFSKGWEALFAAVLAALAAEGETPPAPLAYLRSRIAFWRREYGAFGGRLSGETLAEMDWAAEGETPEKRCSTCAHANHEDGESGVIYCTNRLSFFNGKPMPGTGAWCEKWESSS